MSVVFGPAHAGLKLSLSRMMANYQVRFLEEGVAAMPPPHPTRNRRGVSQHDFAVCPVTIWFGTNPVPKWAGF